MISWAPSPGKTSTVSRNGHPSPTSTASRPHCSSFTATRTCAAPSRKASRCSRRSSSWAARSGWSASRARPTTCRATGWTLDARVALAGGGNRLRELREHLERLLAQLLVVVEAGPGGDQLADDHVLLQATEPVDLSRDRRLGKDTGRLLEGCRRQPARRVERGLDEAEQDGLGHRRVAALRQYLRVGFLVLPLGHDFARQQVGVTGGIDADLPHHLPDDHLDVLVVDVDTLRAVHLLDLFDQVGLDRLASEDM